MNRLSRLIHRAGAALGSLFGRPRVAPPVVVTLRQGPPGPGGGAREVARRLRQIERGILPCSPR